MVEYPSNGSTARGYLAAPASRTGPGVVVIQEWWGLVDHIKDVADRLAGEGFVALVPDLYHGETTTEPDEAAKLLISLNLDQAGKDMSGAVDYVAAHSAGGEGTARGGEVGGGSGPAGGGEAGEGEGPASGGATAGGEGGGATARGGEVGEGAEAGGEGPARGVGVIGFCMGGALALLLGTLRPEMVKAVVPFYGLIVWPATEPDWSKMTAAVQGHYAEHDDSAGPAAVEKMETELGGRGLSVELFLYPGTEHAFFNDTRPEVYDAPASARAWERAVGFLHATLGDS